MIQLSCHLYLMSFSFLILTAAQFQTCIPVKEGRHAILYPGVMLWISSLSYTDKWAAISLIPCHS